MNIIDILVWLLLISGFLVGFKSGVLKQGANLVAFILTLILAFLTKGIVADLLYKFLPFIDFAGVVSLNLILYETVALIIMVLIFWTIIRYILKAVGILDKILKATIVLNLPLKLLGAILGFVEYYIFTFFLLFLLAQPQLVTTSMVNESKTADAILNKSPMTGMVATQLDVFKKVGNLTKRVEASKVAETNYQIVDILLSTKYVKVDTIKYLVENKKLDIPNINVLITQYEGND